MGDPECHSGHYSIGRIPLPTGSVYCVVTMSLSGTVSKISTLLQHMRVPVTFRSPVTFNTEVKIINHIHTYLLMRATFSEV